MARSAWPISSSWDTARDLTDCRRSIRIPMEFNETLWHTLVDHVTVYSDERIVFTFTDGAEIVTML